MAGKISIKLRKEEMDYELPVSMIDVVFLLLIFFMVVTDMSNMEIESVALPFALSAQDDTSKEDRTIVNITDKGEIRMMRQTMSKQDLFTVLKAKAAASPRDDKWKLPTIHVKIRADEGVEYKYVQDVMVQCMRAYIWKLSFGAQPAADEDAMLGVKRF